MHFLIGGAATMVMSVLIVCAQMIFPDQGQRMANQTIRKHFKSVVVWCVDNNINYFIFKHFLDSSAAISILHGISTIVHGTVSNVATIFHDDYGKQWHTDLYLCADRNVCGNHTNESNWRFRHNWHSNREQCKMIECETIDLNCVMLKSSYVCILNL